MVVGPVLSAVGRQTRVSRHGAGEAFSMISSCFLFPVNRALSPGGEPVWVRPIFTVSRPGAVLFEPAHLMEVRNMPQHFKCAMGPKRI
jgi:hypothetical protein